MSQNSNHSQSLCTCWVAEPMRVESSQKMTQGHTSLIAEITSLPNALHSQWAEDGDYQSPQ